MTDIVFLDTETLGLDPDAPIWEFAAVRRDLDTGHDFLTLEIHIQHDAGGWLDDFPDQFARDYHARYHRDTALHEARAARNIHAITEGAHIVGAVPNFDTERLAKLLRRNGIEPAWHYHLIDIENIVVGYLAAKTVHHGVDLTPRLPWNSNELSQAVGVNPDNYERHTAMGDVRWTIAQWDAVMR